MNEIKSYTHIALVLDASGSMARLRESTIGTMKEFFASLKSPDDKTVVDLWQFNDKVVHLIDGMNIDQGADEAIEHYVTTGRTALYDAICTGVDELGRKFAAMAEDARPDAVVFAILTDGFENASEKFSIDDVKTRIEHQAGKYSWTFRFLAANQDAVLSGSRMGIGREYCLSFAATREGLVKSGRMMSEICAGDVRVMARKMRKAREGKRIPHCSR